MGPAPTQEFEGRGLMADQKSYLNFIDMINGGGMGQAGAKFEGGGLLSLLGNALGISPYGSADREEAAKKALAEAAAGAATGGGFKPTGMMSAEDTAMVQPVMRAAELATGGMSPLEAFGGQQPAPYAPAMQYSGRGDVGMPMQYSGRGVAGMPYPQFANDAQTREVMDYLRANGLLNY